MKTVSTILLCTGVLAGCMPGPESGRGFRLPDGDADRGLMAFTDLGCNACHYVAGLDLQFPGTGAASVELGGTVSRVKTYGELVTSIINPSHKLARNHRDAEVSVDGESLMSLADLNQTMTVQQLIDLVTFLQTRYEVVPPQYDPYGYVYP